MRIEEISKNVNETTLPILLIGEVEIETVLEGLKIASEDYLIVEGQTVKIEFVKEGIKFLQFKPLKSSYRLLIIGNSDKMTAEAANALLKTLEEAPGQSKIILLASQEDKILPTIHSRCRKLRMTVVKNYEEPEGYLSPEDLKEMSLADRFEYVKAVAEAGDAPKIVTLWEVYYRKKMLEEVDVITTLKSLARAKGLLETNISVKLLLENIVMDF